MNFALILQCNLNNDTVSMVQHLICCLEVLNYLYFFNLSCVVQRVVWVYVLCSRALM